MKIPTLETSRSYYHIRLPKTVYRRVINLEGFTITDDGSVGRFSREVYTPQLATLAAGIISGFEIETEPLSALADANPDEPSEPGVRILQATASDLDIINRYHAPKAQTEETVRVYERYIVNDAPARNGIWFTKRALEKFADDYAQGRSRLLYHDRRNVVGRTFAAEVVKKKIRGISANWVRVREYIPVITSNEETISKVDTGVYAFDSIGFSGGEIELKEYKVNDDQTRYFIQVDFNPEGVPVLEGGEVSYVFLGAIYGAGNDKQQNAQTEVPVDVSGETGNSSNPKDETELWLSWR